MGYRAACIAMLGVLGDALLCSYRGALRPPASEPALGGSKSDDTTSCRAVRMTATPAAVICATLALIHIKRIHMRRTRRIDELVTRCTNSLMAEDGAAGGDASVSRVITWPADAAVTLPVELGELGQRACHNADGVAVRSVRNVGVGVVACDIARRTAAVLLVRDADATQVSEAELRSALLRRPLNRSFA